MSVLAFSTARAQSVRVADSLLAAGALDRAESLYSAAARVRPRDAVARWALGRYLAQRGATRVAATLMEEALKFGGDPHVIAPDLGPLYERLGEYRELLALPGATLSAGERSRAAWLADHPTRLIAPDTVLVASYRGLDAAAGFLGELPIRIDGRAVVAAIAPRAAGLVLSDTASTAGRLRRYASPPTAASRERSALAAAADSIGIGRLVLTNVPVTISPIEGGHQAVIGLDILARFAPTFDSAASRVILRPAGTLTVRPAGATVLPTLLTRDDFEIQKAGGWLSAGSPQFGSLVAGRRWSFDARRGSIVIEP